MRVELHDAFGKPLVAEATRIVIYDQYDNPLALAVECNDGIFASTRNQPDFQRFLYALGVDKLVIIQRVAPLPLSEISP